MNGAGIMLEQYVDLYDLICVNDFRPTYRNSQSEIDLFLINSNMHRKIKYCQTLTHENVRSDHIGVLMDFDVGVTEEAPSIQEKYSLKKVDWEKWKVVSEDSFREWNSVKRDGEHTDETVESFMTVFHSCMEKVVPKVKIKEGFRRNKAPWLNDEVEAAKH